MHCTDRLGRGVGSGLKLERTVAFLRNERRVVPKPAHRPVGRCTQIFAIRESRIYNENIVLKPQDVYVTLKIVAAKSRRAP
jgi:hypothetical protein